MATTDQIVHLIKKFRKQKSSVSLSYPWNGPKLDQKYVRAITVLEVKLG